MPDLLVFVTFVLTASIPILAIIGELHHRTPTTLFHSIVRSVICLASLFFVSEILNPAYHPKLQHLIIVSIVFMASCFQLYLEIHDETIDEFLKHKKESH